MPLIVTFFPALPPTPSKGVVGVFRSIVLVNHLLADYMWGCVESGTPYAALWLNLRWLDQLMTTPRTFWSCICFKWIIIFGGRTWKGRSRKIFENAKQFLPSYNRMTCVEVKKEALFLLTRFRKCFVRNVMTIVSISLSMGHLLRNYRRIIHLDGSWNALSYILLPLLFSCKSRAHRHFYFPV